MHPALSPRIYNTTSFVLSRKGWPFPDLSTDLAQDGDNVLLKALKRGV